MNTMVYPANDPSAVKRSSSQLITTPATMPEIIVMRWRAEKYRPRMRIGTISAMSEVKDVSMNAPMQESSSTRIRIDQMRTVCACIGTKYGTRATKIQLRREARPKISISSRRLRVRSTI